MIWSAYYIYYSNCNKNYTICSLKQEYTKYKGYAKVCNQLEDETNSADILYENNVHVSNIHISQPFI